MAEGIIFVEGGRCRGLGSGEDLLRTVTESRTDAALARFNQAALALHDEPARRVANAAAQAKRQTKHRGVGVYLLAQPLVRPGV